MNGASRLDKKGIASRLTFFWGLLRRWCFLAAYHLYYFFFFFTIPPFVTRLDILANKRAKPAHLLFIYPFVYLLSYYIILLAARRYYGKIPLVGLIV